MLVKIGGLILVCLLILVGAHFVFKQIPKPSFVDRGNPVVCETIPGFAQYSVAKEMSPIAAVNFASNSRAESLKAEILAASSSGVNFAGKYLLVEGSCGYLCQNHAIVNVATGNVTHYGLRTTGGVDFRADSTLLIANPVGENIRRYYTMAEDGLHVLCEKD